MSRLPAPTPRAAAAADGIDAIAAVLVQGVLRLHRRDIAAAPAGKAGIVPSHGFSPESGDPCLEVCSPSRPCEGTRVNGSPLGDVARDARREGASR